MNAFMDQLDQDMIDNHLNTSEFGEDVVYYPSSGDPARTIPALFDAPFASASTEATEDVIDNRPHLTCREADIDGGEIVSGDRFEIRGKQYRPVDDASNMMGVIRTFLHEVTI